MQNQATVVLATEPHECRPTPDGKACPYCMRIYLAKSRIKWEAFLKRIGAKTTPSNDNRVLAAIMNQEE